MAEAEPSPGECARVLDWKAEPVHVSLLAARFDQDDRARAVMAVYAETDHYDTQALLGELMEKGNWCRQTGRSPACRRRRVR